jgi:transposase
MTAQEVAPTAPEEDPRLQNTLLRERCAQLETENKLLRQKVDLLVRRCFGAKSESLSPAQLELLLTGNEESPPSAPPGKDGASRVAFTAGDTLEAVPPEHAPASTKTARRPRLAEHLPVVEEFIDPPEVLADPDAFRRIGEERTEQLDYTPGRFFQRHTVRRKYVRKKDPGAVPVIAPLTILQDRCVAAPALLAHIIVAKYCDHLPLYRQEQIFKTRHDVLLPRQTMARWLTMAAFWLSGVCREITRTVLAGGCVQIDETAIKYLDPGQGKTSTGYLWAMHRPGGDTVFQWHTSRAAGCLETLIPKDWKGTIQCDGYSAYDAFAASRGQAITLVACMAHIRRDIFEAKEEAPTRAGWLLGQIQNLYQIEKRLR